MKIRELHRAISGNESGFVLVLAMLIMVILVVVGTTSTKSSRIELQIAGNDKSHKMAFYDADAGIYGVPKLISAAVDNSAPPSGVDLGSISYLTDQNGANFYDQIMGFASDDGGVVDLQVVVDVDNDGVDEVQASVNVERLGAEHLTGGGVEFGSGAEGAGVGSLGGVAIKFEETAAGSSTGTSNASASLKAVYRKVTGVAGGL